jgi:hypothetical protein
MRCTSFAVLAMLLAGASPLAAIEIGAPAPPLGTVTWIKDLPVSLTGAFTVIEFWSTTAPTESIIQLSGVQRAHRAAVQVVGLSSEPLEVVRPFVDDLGGDMDYHVGVVGAASAAAWMPSTLPLPHLFIVDREGRLAWQGGPDEFAGMLDRLLRGGIDTALLARLAPLERQLEEVLSREHADQDADDALALDITAKLIAIDPANLKAITTRLWLAAQLRQQEVASATLAAVPVDRLSADEANALARDRLGEEDPAFRFVEQAYGLAKRARDLAPDHAAYRDTYARFLAQTGLLDAAIAEQHAAIACDPEDDALVANLDYYESLRGLRARIELDLKQPLPIAKPAALRTDHPPAAEPATIP